MANMMDYLDWRGDITMDRSPFNEVDNLILAQLAYLNFDYIVPPATSDESVTIREACERYFALYDDETAASLGYLIRVTAPLLKKLGDCPRFAEVRMGKFVNLIDLDQTKQFSAVQYWLDDGTIYVAYRGTDNTIVGWKENFHMSFTTPVPAQFEALRYLEDTAGESGAPLRIGGHSKGGNLAVYAAVKCRPAIRSRILEVYNNDGPGFDARMTRSAEYRSMLGRIRKIVPQSSIVGILLEHEEEYIVVRSSQKFFMQHDAFSWEVLGPEFVHADRIAEESALLDMALKSWLRGMSRSQREQFVDALFHVFEAAEVRSFRDFSEAKWRKVRALIKALNDSPENKEILTRTFRLLFQEGKKVFLKSWEPKLPLGPGREDDDGRSRH